MRSLSRSYFQRNTNVVARELLGCVLVHQIDGLRVTGRIVETEAYTGWDDEASHGQRGLTDRNKAMFGPVGVSYIYFIYGMYWLFNIIAKPVDVDYPAAILIRALEPLEGLDYMEQQRSRRSKRDWTNGPGKLTVAMGIDGHQHDGMNLVDSTSPIWLEEGINIPDEMVAIGPRVGLGKGLSSEWRDKPWRYWIKNNKYVST